MIDCPQILNRPFYDWNKKTSKGRFKQEPKNINSKRKIKRKQANKSRKINRHK